MEKRNKLVRIAWFIPFFCIFIFSIIDNILNSFKNTHLNIL
ncbi:hypothetical protein HMPREF1057_01609 [Bacteroides finegoldii CL09T03C10]|uniref:Uncharacterized protein n=1 Tax=Bacteroides finegoldii CL09T03C10 TaxID=997888 RepID=K5CN91_9BACE|nr:hypothetical protein HMPREF1057_01609 [Bacteroides finegoldii CL09T03C10]